MHKPLIVICFFLSLFDTAFSQIDSVRIDSFLIQPSKTIAGSRFNNINFSDNRGVDTTNLGYILEGDGLRDFKLHIVQPQIPFEKQFAHFIDSVNSFADTGKLLVQLDRLKFEEIRVKEFVMRFFSFRANLYAASQNGYCLLDAIDTTVTVKIKKQKDLLIKYHAIASDIISGFICRNLPLKPVDTINYLTYHEVQKIDSIKKSKISLYTADTLTEGVYATYESLKNQTPDHTDFEVKIKDGILKKVEKASYQADGDMDYSYPKKYAVITGNKIFIHIDGDYFELEKRDRDFFFIRKIEFGTDVTLGQTINMLDWVYSMRRSIYRLPNTFTSPLLAAQLIGLFFNKPKKAAYEFKLDYRDGGFIPLKKTEVEK